MGDVNILPWWRRKWERVSCATQPKTKEPSWLDLCQPCKKCGGRNLKYALLYSGKDAIVCLDCSRKIMEELFSDHDKQLADAWNAKQA